MSKTTLEVVEWDIDKLIGAEYNPRKLSEEQKQTIKDSINRFGLVDPVIVNTNKERHGIIIGGHQRTKVAREMGFQKMPCVELDLSIDQEKELNVRLNKNTGSWDNEILSELFQKDDLIEWGFGEDELEFFEPEEIEAVEDEFDGELPTEPQTVLGDLYELNGHRVHCASSTEIDAVEKLMDGKKADMVFTDPPYNVDYGNIKHKKFKVRNIENDNMSGEDFNVFCRGFASCIKAFCDGIIYCWAGPGKDGRIMFTVLDEFFHCSTTIVWNKDQFTLGRGKYQNKWEPCWFGWNGSGNNFVDDRKLTNVWDYPRPKRSELHPTMKPIEVCCKGIQDASKKGMIVLDLFLGSGSTLIASEQLNRQCYGQELDPKYCDVIVKRWVKYMKDNGKSLTVKRNGADVTKDKWLYE